MAKIRIPQLTRNRRIAAGIAGLVLAASAVGGVALALGSGDRTDEQVSRMDSKPSASSSSSASGSLSAPLTSSTAGTSAAPADTTVAVPADTATPAPADTATPAPADTATPAPAGTTAAGAPQQQAPQQQAPQQTVPVQQAPADTPAPPAYTPPVVVETTPPPVETTPPPPAFTPSFLPLSQPAGLGGLPQGSAAQNAASKCASGGSCATGVQWGTGCGNAQYTQPLDGKLYSGWALYETAPGQCRWATAAFSF